MDRQNEIVTSEKVLPVRMTCIVPKPIAKITICGAFYIIVYDTDNWILPTEEQRKNLKDMFCIDVEILDS